MLQDTAIPASVDILVIAGYHWLMMGAEKGIRSSLRMKLEETITTECVIAAEHGGGEGVQRQLVHPTCDEPSGPRARSRGPPTFASAVPGHDLRWRLQLAGHQHDAAAPNTSGPRGTRTKGRGASGAAEIGGDWTTSWAAARCSPATTTR